MKNQICDHCKYKWALCAWGLYRMICPLYRDAQFKRCKRKRIVKFGDDFNAEDRYDAMLGAGWTLAFILLLFMVLCTIKVMGEWGH